METLAPEMIQAGWRRTLGELSLSADEIIETAKVLDPQPLHTDPHFASKTMFKGLIASGLHPYIEFHKRYWIPMVQGSFICGLGLGGARFEEPVYPEQTVRAELEILATKPQIQKGTQVVSWRMRIFDAPSGRQIQTIDFTTYHWLPRSQGGEHLA